MITTISRQERRGGEVTGEERRIDRKDSSCLKAVVWALAQWKMKQMGIFQQQREEGRGKEEESAPAGDADDSASASVATENGKKEVDKSPLPSTMRADGCRCLSA